MNDKDTMKQLIMQFPTETRQMMWEILSEEFSSVSGQSTQLPLQISIAKEKLADIKKYTTETKQMTYLAEMMEDSLEHLLETMAETL